MSGGSRDYFFSKLMEQADLENAADVNELIKDLATLFHDEEWYRSCDTSKEDYEASLALFREKWIQPARTTNAVFSKNLELIKNMRKELQTVEYLCKKSEDRTRNELN